MFMTLCLRFSYAYESPTLSRLCSYVKSKKYVLLSKKIIIVPEFWCILTEKKDNYIVS